MVVIDKPHIYLIVKWCTYISIYVHLFLIVLVTISEYYNPLKELMIVYMWYIVNLVFIPAFFVSIAGILIVITYVVLLSNCED